MMAERPEAHGRYCTGCQILGLRTAVREAVGLLQVAESADRDTLNGRHCMDAEEERVQAIRRAREALEAAL